MKMVRCYTDNPPQRREGSEAKSKNRRPPRDDWGHKMKKKNEKSTRICFANVRGIGLQAKHPKSEEIRMFMDENTVDIMGLAETNVNWGKVRNRDTLWDRTKQWFRDRKIGVSYNTRQRITTREQPGGTATIATNDMAHRFQSSGFDKSGLGRWSWIRVTGKQNCVTRFVSVYGPSARSGAGTNTVYEQHLEFLQTDPIKDFWNSLAKEIMEWQNKGEQLILMGDWNEDIAGTPLRNWMEIFGLQEAITDIHGNKPPSTYHRGSHAIDGIFVSPSIKAIRAGYLAFGDTPGDHRCIWIDVPHKMILGYHMADIPRANARRLKLDDPRTVQKYQDILDIFLSSRQVYSRLRELRNTVKPGQQLSPTQEKNYESIDRIRFKGMKIAEKKCRKLKMGKKQWSPALQKARDTILFWTLIKRRLKRCKVGARRILKLKKKLKIQRNTHLTLQEVDIELSLAYKQYRVCRKHHKELRMNFLESLAQAKADKGDQKASQIVKDIQYREKVRSMYKRIKYATKNRQCATTKLHVTTRQGMREVTKKSEMEKYIIRENEKKFHQTENRCPLLHGRLYKDIGVMGDGPKVEAILQGTYKPPQGTSDTTKRWLKRMAIKDKTKLRTAKTSLSEYRRGWKLIKEQTASGELHMGHFKAGSIHKNLSWVHFQMSMIPMSTGYSPHRWRKGINVMLLKKPDVYLLEKLRTIVLYEADFNHENKRLGRNAMRMAISQGLIAKEQFSRPGRSAQDNALAKRLVFDYYRLKKKPFAMCACDLKACYDRVVHNAASLALQRVGIPLNDIKCMFGTIQQLVHRIRTAFGLSNSTYGGTWKRYRKPPQGLGQGNGAGPTIWSVLSSTIFEELHDRGYSTAFCFALSRGLFRSCGFSYVDDCDLIASGDTSSEVFNRLQEMLHLWDEYMEVNGAALAPDKCWWYLVDFTWSGGIWKYSDAGVGKSLKATDMNNKEFQVKYLSYSDAQEMVGVFLAPNGKEEKQISALSKKAYNWASKIRASPLDDTTIWIALNRTIIPGLEYPLAATTLSEIQLNKVMSPILQTALPKSGFTRHFPRSVVYGPVATQGLGVDNLFDYQFCRHVQDIVDQSWRNTPTGNHILANLEAVKLEAGVFWHLFDNPIQIEWFNTTNSWVIETHKYCRKNSILFEEPGDILKPQCQADRALMELFATAGCSTEELKGLNRCRLFHQIVSLSDIMDGKGQIILQKWFSRTRHHRCEKYDWPSQGPPTQNDWDLWRTMLQRLARTAIKPLGNWTLSKKEYFQWEWFVSAENDLLQFANNSWYRYPIASLRLTRRSIYNVTERVGIPSPDNLKDYHRTQVIFRGHTVEHSGFRPRHRIRHDGIDIPAKTWLSQIQRHAHAPWICQWLKLPNDDEACSKVVYDGMALGVSDGSYNDATDICTAAWIIDMGDIGTAKGGGVVPGPIGFSNAYRGELGGLLGQLLVIQALEQCYPPNRQYSIKVACDGKSALFKSLLSSRDNFTSRNKSFDLIAQIITLQESIQGKLIPVHVYGHQDEERHALSDIEVLNVRMDTLANEILQTVSRHDLNVPDALPLTSAGIIQVDYGDIPITSSLAKTLRYYVARDRILDWWRYKNRFSAGLDMKDIDWIVLKKTSEEQTFEMGRFVSKWTSHHIAVGRMMELRKARMNNECPRCGAVEETTLHVLRCRHKSARKQWRKEIKKIETWMHTKHTRPEIQSAISNTLRQFNKQGNFENYIDPTSQGAVRRCLTLQSRIGWTGFLEGLFSPAWARLQQSYYHDRDLRFSGSRWAIGLSTRLWKMVFAMWDHRNTALFSKDKIDELSGIEHVEHAIYVEKELGLQGLDPAFLPYLNLSHSSFSKLKSIDLRRWLCLIRQAREDQGQVYDDEISTNHALRQWVGLSDQNTHTQDHPQRQRKQRQQLRFIRTGYID